MPVNSRCHLQPQLVPASTVMLGTLAPDWCSWDSNENSYTACAGRVCFDKDKLFYLGRTHSKDRRESRPTCCRSSMYTASSALAGCSLHWPGQRVILLWMNLPRALQSYSSFRNTASGAVVEQCPWDCAITHHLAFIPLVGNLQHGTDSSVSSRNYWKDFFPM